MTRYAASTTVSSQASRQEIERITEYGGAHSGLETPAVSEVVRISVGNVRCCHLPDYLALINQPSMENSK